MPDSPAMSIRSPTVTTLALVGILALASAASAGALGLVANGDCEETSDDPRSIPHWTRDGRAGHVLQVPGIGTGTSTACVLVGPATIRSAQLLPVSEGTLLNLRADVFEARDDAAQEIVCCDEDWDSVVVVEFVDATGGAILSLRFHCDEYEASQDLDLDSRPDGGTCDAVTGARTMVVPTPSHLIPKYRDPIVVPTGASHARVMLGGSLVTEPALLVGVSTPTSVTVFDNVDLQ